MAATWTWQNKTSNRQSKSFARAFLHRPLQNNIVKSSKFGGLRKETSTENRVIFHLGLSATLVHYSEANSWCHKKRLTHPAIREILSKNINSFFNTFTGCQSLERSQLRVTTCAHIRGEMFFKIWNLLTTKFFIWNTNYFQNFKNELHFNIYKLS